MCSLSSARLELPPFIDDGSKNGQETTHFGPNFLEFDLPGSKFFKLGHLIGNESPWLATVGIIFLRYHNQIARKFQSENRDWSDEQVFQKSKRYVTSVYQNIVVNEWLPDVFGVELSEFREKLDRNVGTEKVFSECVVGLLAWSMSVTPSEIAACDVSSSQFDKVPRLCNIYWKMLPGMRTYGIDRLVLDMSGQILDSFDNFIVEDVSEYGQISLMQPKVDLFEDLVYFSRDSEVSSFQSLAKYLEDISEFDGSSNSSGTTVMQQAISAELDQIYGKTQNWDFPIGLLVNPESKLLQKLLKIQFENLRDNSENWFESGRNGLSSGELSEIKNIRIIDIISNTTEISKAFLFTGDFTDPDNRDSVQKRKMFKIGDDYVCEVRTSIKPGKHCKPRITEIELLEKRYHNYQLHCAILVIFFLCLPSIILLVRHYLLVIRPKKKETEKLKSDGKKEARKTMQALPRGSFQMMGNDQVLNVFSKLDVFEFESVANVKRRRVRLKLNEFSNTASYNSTKLDVLSAEHSDLPLIRSIDCTSSNDVSMIVCTNSETVFCLSLPKEYDLLVEFKTVNERFIFIRWCERVCKLPIRYLTSQQIFSTAFTKEDREQSLAEFFKSSFGSLLKTDNKTSEKQDTSKNKLFNCVKFLLNSTKQVFRRISSFFHKILSETPILKNIFKRKIGKLTEVSVGASNAMRRASIHNRSIYRVVFLKRHILG